jgi:hypothetical protein
VALLPNRYALKQLAIQVEILNWRMGIGKEQPSAFASSRS